MDYGVSPVFYKNLESTTKITVNQGGTRCFEPSQLVVTKQGSKPIGELLVGDVVLCCNVATGENVFRPVKTLFHLKNTKPTVRITLKNGAVITCTDDHRFYFRGHWVMIKDILSLRDAKRNNMGENTQLHPV